MLRTLTPAFASLVLTLPLAAQSPCIEGNIGADLGLGDDQVALNRPLGFAFPFNNTAVSAVSVSSNGFVWLASDSNSGCCSGSISDLLSQAPRIAPAWTDLDPSSGGSVHFNTFPGRAVITWDQVPEYGYSTPLTVQLQLFADGRFSIFWDGGVTIDGHSLLVGISPGRGAANPGARDLSNLPLDSGSVPTVYQLFSAATFDLQGRVLEFTPNGSNGYRVDARGGCSLATFSTFGSSCPLAPPLTLSSVSRPVLGSTFAMIIGEAPAGSTAAFMIYSTGATTGIPLDGVGMTGCRLWVPTDVVVPTVFHGRYTQVSLPIPQNPSAAGRIVNAQGGLLAVGANPAGVVVTNGGRMELGS